MSILTLRPINSGPYFIDSRLLCPSCFSDLYVLVFPIFVTSITFVSRVVMPAFLRDSTVSLKVVVALRSTDIC